MCIKLSPTLFYAHAQPHRYPVTADVHKAEPHPFLCTCPASPLPCVTADVHKAVFYAHACSETEPIYMYSVLDYLISPQHSMHTPPSLLMLDPDKRSLISTSPTSR